MKKKMILIATLNVEDETFHHCRFMPQLQMTNISKVKKENSLNILISFSIFVFFFFKFTLFFIICFSFLILFFSLLLTEFR